MSDTQNAKDPPKRELPSNDMIWANMDSAHAATVEKYFCMAISRNSHKLMGDNGRLVVERLAGLLDRLDDQATARMIRVFVVHAKAYACTDLISERVAALHAEREQEEEDSAELGRVLQGESDGAELTRRLQASPADPAVAETGKRLSQKKQRKTAEAAAQAGTGFAGKTPKFVKEATAAD